ncbi:MAG: NADH-quinone oxidoreductase subunit C [Anaerolineae bacterium]
MSQETVAALKARFPDAVYDVIEAFGETTVVIDRAIIREACALLRDTPGLDYNFIADITGVDYYPDAPRFAVCYHLYSMLHNRIIRLKVYVPEDDAVIPSLIGEWPLVNWPEREIQDMLGIDFEGHPDKRRLLMPEDWDGHPLRKDYPLGKEEVQFSFNWQEIDANKPYAKK